MITLHFVQGSWEMQVSSPPHHSTVSRHRHCGVRAGMCCSENTKGSSKSLLLAHETGAEQCVFPPALWLLYLSVLSEACIYHTLYIYKMTGL